MFAGGSHELMSINRGASSPGANTSDLHPISLMKLGSYPHCTMAKALFGLLFTCFYLEAMTASFKGEGNYGFMSA